MPPDAPETEELVAALDLGSNSFHMIVGRLSGGRLTVVDRMREPVRLGAGLDEKKNLTPEAETRALECLKRLGERAREMKPGRVRAVGTNTLRQARNAAEFLERAREALGHPIEIIAGAEEARLIYLGVIQTMPADHWHRFVVDIGGGSTECIIGERSEIIESDSLFMGCISYSLSFFPNGKITEAAFDAAEMAAKVELQSIARRYRALGWTAAIGCSGTVHAVARISLENEWSREGITQKALKKVRKALISAGSAQNLSLLGLVETRKPVIAGGVAILSAIFDSMKVEKMLPSPGALREGTLYDLVGRIRHEDVRDRTIRNFCRHHAVDMTQVVRIERTAVDIAAQVAPAWSLDVALGERLLSWAAHLHEIGLSISHNAYHKHSAYVVQNADMPGFSTDDQRMLAAVILGHRRSMRELTFEEVPKKQREEIVRLTLIFRVAFCLHRSRSDDGAIPLRAEARGKGLAISLPRGWLGARPLTRVTLERQIERLARIGYQLSFLEHEEPAASASDAADPAEA